MRKVQAFVKSNDANLRLILKWWREELSFLVFLMIISTLFPFEGVFFWGGIFLCIIGYFLHRPQLLEIFLAELRGE